MSVVPEASAINNDLDTSINNVGECEIPLAVDNGRKKEIINNNKKKKSGPFSFFRAALVALSTTESKKKKSVAPEKADKIKDNNNPPHGNGGDWKNIVGSMRPLHLQQDNPSTPPSIPPVRVLSADSLDLKDMIINMHLQKRHPYLSPSPSPSPSASPFSCSSSAGTMSQYASASNLQALDDVEEEDDDPDVVFDAISGDDMIDSKAEEFIAQFYQQMKLDHHHHQHHRRGDTAFF